jgi:hypothetical protein
MRSSARSTWFSVSGLCLAVFVAIGGCGSDAPNAKAKPPKPPEDFVMQAADFKNLHDMTPVRGFFVDNELGHLKEAVAIAEKNQGGAYPVGTILQLFPQEAMIKRRKGYNAKTSDWEFFSLATDASGTKILTHGADKVVNRFGGNCASCHELAKGKFDMVCEKNHGCEPLPIGEDLIHALQAADPRPRATKN